MNSKSSQFMESTIKKKTTLAFRRSMLSLAVGLAVANNAYAEETSVDSTVSTAEAGAAVMSAVDIDQVETINVVGRRMYLHQQGSSGTKMNMSVIDTPQAMKIITEDVIKAANIRSFEDVYKVDASASSSHSIDSFPRNYFRGFATQGSGGIKIDGFRFTAQLDLDLATFERFEIVKGPTSTLYGQTSVGGTVNAISKKPQSEFALEASVSVGSFNQYRGDFDITGALTEDGDVRFRFITAVEDNESFIDYVENNLILLAPSVEFDVGDNTTVLAQVNYQEHDDRYHWGSPMKRVSKGSNEMEIADIPHSQFFGMPWNSAQRKALLTQISINHTF